MAGDMSGGAVITPYMEAVEVSGSFGIMAAASPKSRTSPPNTAMIGKGISPRQIAYGGNAMMYVWEACGLNEVGALSLGDLLSERRRFLPPEPRRRGASIKNLQPHLPDNHVLYWHKTACT